MDYNIKINEFEGPLDLLLHLIKQSNIDIMDIEINEITTQYLDYINKMKELHISVAASYLVMAAELMEIKSKSLLPTTEVIEDEEDNNLSKETLINKLIEYKKYKDMVNTFKSLENDRKNIYIKSPEKVTNYLEKVIINNNDNSLDDLVDAFKKFLDRKDKEKPLTTKITSKEYSIKDRKKNILNVLKEKKQTKFTDLFEENNIPYIIVTFLSILEMTKENLIKIKQDDNFKDIIIELEVTK